MRTNIVKNAAAGAVLGGSLLFTAGLGLANAQPVEASDGLVNLAVGETTILENASTDAVVAAATAICGSATTDLTALVEQVATEGTQQTACTGLPSGGDLVLTSASGTTEQPGVTGGAAEVPGVTGSADGTGTVPGAEHNTVPGAESSDTATVPGSAG